MTKTKKNITKGILSVLLTAMLLIGMIPFGVFAEDISSDTADKPIEYYGRAALADMTNSTALLYAYDRITVGIGASETEIAVCNGTDAITQSELETVLDAYRRDHTEHFWLGDAYSIRYSNGTTSLLPSYVMSGRELETAKKAFNKAVGDLLSDISPAMSEYEREKLLHDRLAAKVCYDKSAPNAHNAYGALVEGKAVCDGYAEAYQYLLQCARLQSFIAIGTSVNPETNTMEGHAWNIVRIDGSYYHLDLTWNDHGEYLFYSYFNVTDALIKKDHTITETACTLPVCNSEAADYFTVSGGKMETFDAATVGTMMKNGRLTAHVYVTGDKNAFTTAFKENINTVATLAGVSGSFSYGYACCGREYILLIKTFHTVSGKVTSFSNDTDDVTIQIIKIGTSAPSYEAVVRGNSTNFSIENVATGTYTVKVMKNNHVTRIYTLTVETSDVTQDVTVFPLGDITADGTVDILDLIRLKKINVKTAAAKSGTSADINADGDENAADLVDLRKKILGVAA